MKLGVVCMCKNEQQVIGRMITSVAEIADIFIFTDTGSTDDTLKTIEKTCKQLDKPYEIHHSEFVDFGTTRTNAVKNAKGKADYFLLLDADMTIEDKGFNVNMLSKDGYHVFYSDEVRYAQLLIVKGSLDWYYIGKTHEYIFAKGMKTLGEVNDLIINHHVDGSNRKDKYDRDEVLLKKQIEENPDDRRAYFYLAETFRLKQDFHGAIEYYKKRIAKGGWKEEVYYSIYQLGRMFYYIGELDQARLTLIDAWEFRPQRLESIHALSLILRQTKKFNQAALFLEKALDTKFPKDDLLFVERPIYDFMIRFEYSICLFYIGKKREALKQTNILLNQKNIPEKFYNQTVRNRELIVGDLNRDVELRKKNPKFNQKVVFVSGYTKGTPYEKEIEKLRETLQRFGLYHHIYEFPNQGSWTRNTQEKPKYIFRALEEYKCPVVWIDADAKILKKPDYFNTVSDDIQFYEIKEWKDFLTGTVFFNYNLRVKEFLTKWIYNCEIQPYSSQKVFIATIKQASDLIVGDLPVEYVKIFDNQLQECDDPVIVHNQASRKFKTEIPRVKYVEGFDKENRLKYKRVSIIGNGPFSSDLSKKIDDSYVMRCNNFQISDEFKGIGTKTDMNVSSLYPEIIPGNQVDYPIIGAHPIHDIIGNYSDAKHMHYHWVSSKHTLLAAANNILTFNEADEFFDIWKMLADDIGGFPTTGLVAILLAKYWGFKEILLSGFNFFSTNKTHYWTDNPTKPSLHHKPNTEKQVVEKWIKNSKIKFILDDEVKASMNKKEKIDVESLIKK